MLSGIITFPFVSGPIVLWEVRKAADFIFARQDPGKGILLMAFSGDEPKVYDIPPGYYLTWTDVRDETKISVMKIEEWENLVKDNPLHLR